MLPLTIDQGTDGPSHEPDSRTLGVVPGPIHEYDRCPPARLPPRGLPLQLPSLLQGKEFGWHGKPTLTGRKPSGRNLIAAASLPLGLLPGAPTPNMLNGFALEAIQAYATVPLPVPSDSSDGHVADNGCLESLSGASGCHAVCHRFWQLFLGPFAAGRPKRGRSTQGPRPALCGRSVSLANPTRPQGRRL